MSTKDFIRANSGVQDPFLWNTENDPFFPKEWDTTNVFMFDWRPIKPTNSVTAPSQVGYWKLPKISDRIAKVRFEGDVVVTATGGTYLRLVDWFGVRVIKKIDVSYNGNLLQTITAKQMYDRMIIEDDEQDVHAAGVLAGGNWTKSQRENAVAGGATWHFQWDLPLFFTVDPSYALQTIALSNEISIDVTIEDPGKLVETDGTSPVVTLSNIQLSILALHATPMDRAKTLKSSMMEDGFIFKFVDYVSQQYQSPANETAPSIQLTAIRGPVIDLRTTRQRDSNINSTTFANDPNVYELIPHVNEQANGSDVFRNELGNSMLFYHNRLFHRGPVGSRIYSISHAIEPDHKIHSTGSLNYGNLNAPTVVLTQPAINEVTWIDICGVESNFIQLKGGDIIKIFK
jgi:major capsid protein